GLPPAWGLVKIPAPSIPAMAVANAIRRLIAHLPRGRGVAVVARRGGCERFACILVEGSGSRIPQSRDSSSCTVRSMTDPSAPAYPLEPSAEEMRAIGQQALDTVVRFIQSMPEAPAVDLDGVEEVIRLLAQAPPPAGRPFPEVIAD